MTTRTFIDMPKRIERLPRDSRGFPVPFFVKWIDGVPHFEIIDPQRMALAIKQRRCWICGDVLGRHLAFVVGPMCTINRVTSEPPSHRDCAIFAAKNCPFLSRPLAKRLPLPENHKPPAGVHFDKNPGATAVWITQRFAVFRAPMGNPGLMFRFGDPEEVLWFTQGRPGEPAEIARLFEKGANALLDMGTRLDGPEYVPEMQSVIDQARKFLPARI